MSTTHVFIGRFQPWHNGHQEIAKAALEKSNQLIILVGSAGKTEDFKNPFSFEERKDFIEKSLRPLFQNHLSKFEKKSIKILPIKDYLYNNNKWLAEVHNQVYKNSDNNEIFLTGYEKDESSEYLKYFPKWKKDFLKTNLSNIDAKTIRQELFLNNYNLKNINDFNFLVPEAINSYLYSFTHKNKSKRYLNLKDEMEFVINYKKQFDVLRYKIPLLTGDAVVICAGNVLLVKRRSLPGKGLFALPGGFFDVDKDYDQVDTALRELKEETKIKIPTAVLKGSIKKIMDFSDPTRSLRGRILTKAVLIQLEDIELPKIKTSDETDKVFWLPIGQLNDFENKLFEDHYQIIQTIIGL